MFIFDCPQGETEIQEQEPQVGFFEIYKNNQEWL